MDYVIAIPSYNRAERLGEKTLATLRHYGIPAAKIHIFVADNDQLKTYQEHIPKDLYGKMIVAQKGIKNVRNFIYNYFKEGTNVLSMDDDIEKVLHLNRAGKLTPVASLKDLIHTGFQKTKENGYHLWGLAPVSNAFYMKDTISTDLKFIIFTFYGIIIQKHPIQVSLNLKEDYEMSLAYATQDGGVVRMNGYSVKTKFCAPGGINQNSAERLEEDLKSSKYLMEKYPGLVRENPRRKGQILLARKIPVKGGKRIHIEGEDDTNISTLPLRNKARYDSLRDTLLKVLRESTVPKIPKPAISAHSNRGTKLGTIGRTITFGYGDTRRGIKEYKTNARFPELLKALIDFGNAIVPKGWDYNGITLNHGVKAKKHKDSKNLGVSYIIGIGDFTGGGIKVWDAEDKHPKVMDLHDKPVGFNGGLLFHQTTPFKGERYTIIYYKQMWEGVIKGHTTKGSGHLEEDEELEGGIYA